MKLNPITTEKDLQQAIIKILHAKGIVVFYQRMDKKTRGVVGQPDLLFAVQGLSMDTKACAWEIKLPKDQCSVEQEKLLDKLQHLPNFWYVDVVRSVEQAIKLLAEMGV